MRLLIPTTEFPPHPGGIATLAFEQAAGLADAGMQTRVLALQSAGEAPLHDAGEIDVRFLNVTGGAILRLVPLFWILMREARVFRPDFLHCPTYRGFGLPVWLVGKLLRIPYALYLHGSEINTEVASSLRKAIMKKVLSGATFIATNSENTARITRDHFPSVSDRIVPVLPGVHMPEPQDDADALRLEWLSAAGLASEVSLVILLAVCRMVRGKGIDTVIEAMADLQSRRPDLNALFVAVGEGSDRDSFKQLAFEKGVGERVLVPGAVPYQLVQRAFAAADIYVQPSRPVGAFLESFGISFLEAQAAGLPCIGSRWGGVPEAVEEGTTAVLIEPGNAGELSAAIERLCQDGHLRSRMSKAAIARAQQMSWKNHCLRLKEVISDRVR